MTLKEVLMPLPEHPSPLECGQSIFCDHIVMNDQQTVQLSIIDSDVESKPEFNLSLSDFDYDTICRLVKRFNDSFLKIFYVSGCNTIDSILFEHLRLSCVDFMAVSTTHR